MRILNTIAEVQKAIRQNYESDKSEEAKKELSEIKQQIDAFLDTMIKQQTFDAKKVRDKVLLIAKNIAVNTIDSIFSDFEASKIFEVSLRVKTGFEKLKTDDLSFFVKKVENLPTIQDSPDEETCKTRVNYYANFCKNAYIKFINEAMKNIEKLKTIPYTAELSEKAKNKIVNSINQD